MLKTILYYRLAGDGFGGISTTTIVGLEAETLLEWYIPQGNPNWVVYQEWLAAGNTPLPLDSEWPAIPDEA